MHGTPDAVPAAGEHDAARGRNDLHVPADAARAVKPFAWTDTTGASAFDPALLSTSLPTAGSHVATDDLARKDSIAQEHATAAKTTVQPTSSTGSGISGPATVATAAAPTLGEEAVRPVEAIVGTARRATLLRETVADAPGTGECGKRTVLPAALSGTAAAAAAVSRTAAADAATADAATADAPAAGAKVVYIVPEQTPPAVRLVLGRRPGWTEWNAEVHAPDEWNFQWRSGRFKPSEYRDVREEQRVNHFPRSSLITRKDLLLRVLRKMKAIHGDVYAFHPDSYLLPTEYTKFIDVFTRLRLSQCTLKNRRSAKRRSTASPVDTSAKSGTDPAMLSQPCSQKAGRNGCGEGDAGDEGALWIVKPSDSSRGRGVYLLRELGELAYDRLSIVQRYISDPLTVGGYKADLRLYVVVTSLHPMRVFVYRDGIVRFATSKYDLSPHDDVFGHLTNCSINKRSPFASQEKDVIGGGCKWTLERLKRWVELQPCAQGAERWQRLWAKICSLVCLTVLPLADVVPDGAGHSSCFELFGFDIMVDSRLSRPHLVEVNCSPALGLDEPADREVKLPLLSDMIDLVGVEKACVAQEALRAAKLSKARSLPGYSRPLGSSPSSSSCPSPLPSHPSVGGGGGRHRVGLSSPRSSSPWRDKQNQEDQQRQQQQQQQQQQPQQASAPKTTTPRPPWTSSPVQGLPSQGKGTARAVEGIDLIAHDEASRSCRGPPAPEHGFELLFPFNPESEDHARRLSKSTGAGKDRETKVQGCIRAIISEIKRHEKRRLVQLKGSSHRRGGEAGARGFGTRG